MTPTNTPRLQDYSHNLTKYERGTQKSQFSNSLVNWEEFGSTVYANNKKSRFSNSFMNWEKMRIPARATFNNPSFQSFFSQKIELYTNPCSTHFRSQILSLIRSDKNL